MSGAGDRPIELALGFGEVELLSSLVGELRLLVAASEPSDDPLDNWAAEANAPPIDHFDPVIQRLFPSAYAATDLDAEYRRLSEPGLRSQKDADARIVERDLARTQAHEGHITVARIDAWAWLRTLNALRLALAARLGIEDNDLGVADAPAGDPRQGMAMVYYWLGLTLESILDALAEDEF
jgi:hypothetical protein